MSMFEKIFIITIPVFFVVLLIAGFYLNWVSGVMYLLFGILFVMYLLQVSENMILKDHIVRLNKTAEDAIEKAGEANAQVLILTKLLNSYEENTDGSTKLSEE